MSCCDHTCGADAGRGKLCPACRADARAMLDEPNAVVLLAPAELEALHAEITRLRETLAACRELFVILDNEGDYPQQSAAIGMMLLAIDKA
jgi:hypothetical protein